MEVIHYEHFVLRTKHSVELGRLLTAISKTVSVRTDDDGPFYMVYLSKQMTVRQVKVLTGCDDVIGVRDDYYRRKTYEALVERGRMILDAVQEDGTTTLNAANLRAVRAYLMSVDDCVSCHHGKKRKYNEMS